MVRELGSCAIVVLCGGCSLFLDFSNKQIPIDSEIDGPYTGDECAYLEPNDTGSTAMMVTTADTGPAAICAPPRDSGLPEDHDFYRFTVPAGTMKVTVAMMSTYRPRGDLDLRLYRATATANASDAIGKSQGFSDTELIVCPGASPTCPMLVAGDYVFEVFPALSGHVNSYTFLITLQ